MNSNTAANLRLILSFLVLSAMTPLGAQNILTEMDHDAHHEYDRMIILSGGGDSSLHTSVKPFWRSDLVILADTFSRIAHSKTDWHMIQRMWDNNNEFTISTLTDTARLPASQEELNRIAPYATRYRTSRHPLWNTFYKTPAYLYEVDVKDFYLRINPMIRLGVGRETNEDVTTFINQRGLSLRGGIGKNVFFQTSVWDSQVRFPNYINTFADDYGVLPGVGLFKNFNSKIFDSSNGRDYLLATAYVGFNIGKYIGMQLGHNQCFIGDGLRSLLFSDFSTPFFSLKINTRIWKFHYQNIFAEMASDDFTSVNGISEPVPKKYMAAHYLDFKPNPRFSLGLFEAVIFNRENNQFELQYLNPIILYRTIEGALGSPDNVLLGFNARMDLWRSVSFYGQFMLDDISISTILDGNSDWWGNKYGYQLGLKYINVLSVDHLDLQVEWNQVRPFTYSHYDSLANYSHYNQALAHPLGANFNEWIVSGSYAFGPRLNLKSSLYFMHKGEDPDTVSFGGNILRPNTERAGDYGHSVGQGALADIFVWSTTITYELAAGIFIDADFFWRKKTSSLPVRVQDTQSYQFGVRYNFIHREDVF